jgi:hypothetical protein
VNRLAVVLVATSARIAVAQPAESDRAEAARLYEQGRQLYGDEQYAKAIRAFETALKLDPEDHQVAFGLARAYEHVFDGERDPVALRNAVKLFRMYLGMPHAKKQQQARDALKILEPQLDAIDKALAAVAVVPAPPVVITPLTTLIISGVAANTQVSLDGGKAQESPGVFDTTPGKHRVVVSAPGYKPTEREETAEEGRTISIELPLEELPATLTVHGEEAEVFIDGKREGEVGGVVTLPSGLHRVTVVKSGHYAWERQLVFERGSSRELTAEPTGTRQRKLAWMMLGGASLFVVMGGVTGVLALTNQNSAESYNNLVTAGTPLTDAQRVAYNSEIDRRDQWRTTSYIMFGAGIAAAATGALLYLLDTPRVEGGAPPPAITPLGGAGTIGMAWQGRF